MFLKLACRCFRLSQRFLELLNALNRFPIVLFFSEAGRFERHRCYILLGLLHPDIEIEEVFSRGRLRATFRRAPDGIATKHIYCRMFQLADNSLCRAAFTPSDVISTIDTD